jgi:hypothetical protein
MNQICILDIHMNYLRANGLATLVLAVVAIDCGGGRFTSGHNDNTVVETTGGTSEELNTGGETSYDTGGDSSTNTGGDTSTQAGASNSGGAPETGGSQGIDVGGTQSGGASTGGSTAIGATTNGAGGTATFGGHVSMAGATAITGTTSSAGGSSSTGGTMTIGGTSNAGGTVSTASTMPTGGTSSTGGSSGTGSTMPTGGTSSVGGSSSTGGSNTGVTTTTTGGQSSVTLTFGERSDTTCHWLTNDTYLNSAAPDLNYGASEVFGCDAEPQAVALLRFYLANCLDEIGSLTQVLAARLHLHTATCVGCEASANTTIQIFEMLEAWDEGYGSTTGEAGAANWKDSSEGVPWSGAGASGASRGATALAEFKPTARNTDYVIALPVALVQYWIDEPYANEGMLLKILSTATSASDGVSFGTSEGDESMSPLLEIDFASP